MANRTLFGKTTSPEGHMQFTEQRTKVMACTSNGVCLRLIKPNRMRIKILMLVGIVQLSHLTLSTDGSMGTPIKDIMSVGAKLIKSTDKWREQYNVITLD